MPSCAFGCCCGILGGGERSCFSLQVLIKKSYDRSRRQRRRNWKLKELERDREATDTDDERFSICSPCSVAKLLQLLNNLQLRGKREKMGDGWVGRIKTAARMSWKCGSALRSGFGSGVLFCCMNFHQSKGKVSESIPHLLQTIPGLPGRSGRGWDHKEECQHLQK